MGNAKTFSVHTYSGLNGNIDNFILHLLLLNFFYLFLRRLDALCFRAIFRIVQSFDRLNVHEMLCFCHAPIRWHFPLWQQRKPFNRQHKLQFILQVFHSFFFRFCWLAFEFVVLLQPVDIVYAVIKMLNLMWCSMLIHVCSLHFAYWATFAHSISNDFQ